MSNGMPQHSSEPEPSYHDMCELDFCRPNSVPQYKMVKPKKRVTFAPDTINYERELKPYKYHNLFRLAQMGIFLNPDGQLDGPEFFGTRRQRSIAVDLSGNTDQLKQKLSKLVGLAETNVFEHEYLKFTHARRTRDYMDKTNGPAATRAQRLYTLIDELKLAHEFYNQLRTTTTRDQFLVEELISRHIMALDLALTEGYMGVALEVTHTMCDTTRFMLPLYAHIFYNEDGSKVDLPFGVIELTGEVEDWVIDVSPIISTLNKICQNRSSTDNRYFSRETLLTKLQLEMLVLTICPVYSVMFRAVLEIVPDTAGAAYDALYNYQSDPVHWANNSALRNDYEIILQNLGLADKVGCKGVNFTMISFAARSKTKDMAHAASLYELCRNVIKE